MTHWTPWHNRRTAQKTFQGYPSRPWSTNNNTITQTLITLSQTNHNHHKVTITFTTRTRTHTRLITFSKTIITIAARGTIGNSLWEGVGSNLWKMPVLGNRLGTARDSRLWVVRGSQHQKLDFPEQTDSQRSLFQGVRILRNSWPMRLRMRILIGQISCL